MHCFSASSVSCVTERLSGCKDTDLYWIRANYYLKKYYSTVAFFDNFNRTTSCITVNELQTMSNVNMVYIIWKQTRYASAYRLLWLATNCLRILDNVFDTVTKCLLPPFKSVEQSKLRHACLSKKKTFVEQTNHSPNDYEKWLLTLLFKYHCKLYLNQRLFGTTIVTNKMNGYDNKPVLMK